MASISWDVNGNVAIQFVNGVRRRKTIRLGKRTDKSVDKIKRKVESLNADAITGKPHAADVARWVHQLEDREPSLYDKLAVAGLVPLREPAGQVTLANFVEGYITGRSGDVKWSTLITYRNAKRNLTEYGKFGPDRLINTINAAEAEDWRRWLSRGKDEENPANGG